MSQDVDYNDISMKSELEKNFFLSSCEHEDCTDKISVGGEYHRKKEKNQRTNNIMIISLFLFFVILLLSIGVCITIIIFHSSQSTDVHFNELSQQRNSIHLLEDHLGSQEYFCTGNCFCQQEENMIRSTSSATTTASKLAIKSLTYIASAVTVYIAYRKAKDYFHQECESLLTCSSDSSSVVKSEIQECQTTPHTEKKGKRKKEGRDDDEEDIRRFLCKGNCVISRNLKSSYTKKRAEDFGCENLIQEGEVEVDGTHFYSPTEFNPSSRDLFTKQYLTNFCKMNSQEEYRVIQPSGQKRWAKFTKCCGKNGSLKRNPTVHCIQVFPSVLKDGPKKYWD